MPKELGLNWVDSLSLTALLLNLGIGVLLSLVLRWHFSRFGSTVSNRQEFAQVFPLMLLTTILIISVIKSSLALSLGLVGALSIVRFRTPIKEPEELAYLFITIAMGLGLGAGQTVSTVVAGLGILFVMAALKWSHKDAGGKNIYLSLDMQGIGGEGSAENLNRLNRLIAKNVTACDLRRFDLRQDCMEAVYFLDVAKSDNLGTLVEELRGAFPGIGATFLDQNQLPTV